ncbi:hypothetical protein E7Z59_13155 [Robertkochia marina]|uniref:Phosphatase PAP2 family protein n=1 Tax=Robertkochia marina TaxID=1227945 RepID=A0A4V3UY02_9FLAO|nr:vanadium-dependent haloperoxidase [Robertkochia marina]THD66724.1 hypothetical protein E7Z59_13155 [Robertkochia marina]TRZ42386.1 hypothetical protein D3A96_12045 [Robertkochia marina]
MKTIFKFLSALIIFTFLFACSRDVAETDLWNEGPNNQEAYNKTYNEGMIKSYGNETIIKWNELLGNAIDEKMPVPQEAKIYAMVTISMHDALNNVVPVYETYALDNSQVNASDISKKNITAIADAAVSQAARDVIVTLFSGATNAADLLLNEVLASIADETQKNKGISIGRQAALAMLEKRQNDLPLSFTPYAPSSNDPGIYQANFYLPVWPPNTVFGQDMGDLTPFGIISGNQFLNESPLNVSSYEYAKDYNEVMTLGCDECPARTAEQSEMAEFWRENIASSTNRLARTFIIRDDLNGWEAARMIAILEMAVIDSFIASFKEKSIFRYWTPVTAIRAGNTDMNPETAGDPSWNSMTFTPPVFEFPSTHTYAAGATSEIFRNYSKKDQISFVTISPYYLSGAERAFSSFSEYTAEHLESRIFLGHNFRYSATVGEQHGKELGKYVLENNLRKIKNLQ